MRVCTSSPTGRHTYTRRSFRLLGILAATSTGGGGAGGSSLSSSLPAQSHCTYDVMIRTTISRARMPNITMAAMDHPSHRAKMVLSGSQAEVAVPFVGAEVAVTFVAKAVARKKSSHGVRYIVCVYG